MMADPQMSLSGTIRCHLDWAPDIGLPEELVYFWDKVTSYSTKKNAVASKTSLLHL